MGLFGAAALAGKISKLAHSEEPKVKAFFEKAETLLAPVFTAYLAKLVQEGTITEQALADIKALEPELLAIEKDLEPLVKEIESL